MGELFRFFIKFVNKYFHRKIVYYKSHGYNTYGSTAVRSRLGFWYSGDISDMSDISYGILSNGLVEPLETELVVKILNLILQKNSLVFYDIGANTGYYGILAGFLAKGRATVFSFEPVGRYYESLKTNVYLNHLEKNFYTFNIALSDSSGKQNFYLAGSGSSLNIEFLDGQFEGKQIVQTEKLDDLAKRENFLPPDFVKIDVEGHEFSVLSGAKQTISSHLPILFVEIAYKINSGKREYLNRKYAETFWLLKNLDYEVFALVSSSWKPYDFNAEKPEGVAMYLFLNKQKHQEFMNEIF